MRVRASGIYRAGNGYGSKSRGSKKWSGKERRYTAGGGTRREGQQYTLPQGQQGNQYLRKPCTCACVLRAVQGGRHWKAIEGINNLGGWGQ